MSKIGSDRKAWRGVALHTFLQEIHENPKKNQILSPGARPSQIVRHRKYQGNLRVRLVVWYSVVFLTISEHRQKSMVVVMVVLAVVVVVVVKRRGHEQGGGE